ncbi:NHERF family PDZ scaffold protein 4b [Pholidichthys leucotaenia]
MAAGAGKTLDVVAGPGGAPDVAAKAEEHLTNGTGPAMLKPGDTLLSAQASGYRECSFPIQDVAAGPEQESPEQQGPPSSGGSLPGQADTQRTQRRTREKQVRIEGWMQQLVVRARPKCMAAAHPPPSTRNKARHFIFRCNRMKRKFTFNPKEGIDNPAMAITGDTEAVFTPTLHLCVLKHEEGETYGFSLQVAKGRRGHIIRNVVSGGVAECSGLRDGDRLLEVNHHYVDDVSHSVVARKIKLSGRQLCVLVLDGEEYEQAVKQGQDLRSLARAFKGGCCKQPRLYSIGRDPVSGLGINFVPLEGQKGRFCVNLVTGGAAERAGVCQGDCLVWINGAMVSNLTHSALSRMMKKCDHITILVIDSESEKSYMQRKIPILPCMAVPHNLPHRARKLHLISGPQGFGFLLRLEMTPSGHTYHVLREMARGSPVEKAAVQDGELLLEVNGESVESLKHEEIVNRVRLSGQHVCLTTITPLGLEFYTQLGLSPLLFSEDGASEKEKENAGRADSMSPVCRNSASRRRLATGGPSVDEQWAAHFIQSYVAEAIASRSLKKVLENVVAAVGIVEVHPAVIPWVDDRLVTSPWTPPPGADLHSSPRHGRTESEGGESPGPDTANLPPLSSYRPPEEILHLSDSSFLIAVSKRNYSSFCFEVFLVGCLISSLSLGHCCCSPLLHGVSSRC